MTIFLIWGILVVVSLYSYKCLIMVSDFCYKFFKQEEMGRMQDKMMVECPRLVFLGGVSTCVSTFWLGMAFLGAISWPIFFVGGIVYTVVYTAAYFAFGVWNESKLFLQKMLT